jgi:putative DNA primase/helicase
MTFYEFMRSCGVLPPDFIEPGKWVRCATEAHPRKKNAAVKLADDQRIGWVQNFETGLETWRPDEDSKPQPIDRAAINARRNARAQEARRATEAARRAYDAAKPLLGTHGYLQSKGLDSTGCFGLRVDRQGWLVVPMLVGNEILSIQRIDPTGDKRFWPGAPTKGAVYNLQRQGAVITLLCEGLATGLTLFSALPNCRVIVTFNSGNLVHIAGLIKISGLCAVCADNDNGTEAKTGINPGLKAGKEAAALIGCGLAYPDYEGTDFNDAEQEFLKQERQLRMFDKGFKRTDATMKKNAHAKIRSLIMTKLKFVTQ